MRHIVKGEEGWFIQLYFIDNVPFEEIDCIHFLTKKSAEKHLKTMDKLTFGERIESKSWRKIK